MLAKYHVGSLDLLPEPLSIYGLSPMFGLHAEGLVWMPVCSLDLLLLSETTVFHALHSSSPWACCFSQNPDVPKHGVVELWFRATRFAVTGMRFPFFFSRGQ